MRGFSRELDLDVNRVRAFSLSRIDEIRDETSSVVSSEPDTYFSHPSNMMMMSELTISADGDDDCDNEDEDDGTLEILRGEQRKLRQKLARIEQAVKARRKESDLLKMKTTILLGQMRLEIDSLEEDKQFLIEQCKKIEYKAAGMQMEKISKARIKELRKIAQAKRKRDVESEFSC